MIWKLQSDPVLAALSEAELKQLLQEACEAKSVRRSSLLGMAMGALCAATGSLIGDAFSIGIYGAGLGGGIGALIYTQLRMQAIRDWIKTRINASASGHGLPP